jgi:transposase
MPVEGDDGFLFEVGPGQMIDPVPRRTGDCSGKTFRAFDPGQVLLLPPSLDDWLPSDHLARFIADLVDEHLDLSPFYAAYDQRRGGPPYDPRLMVRILLYGYTTGVRSSRKLEAACTDVVAFRWLAAGSAPDFRAIGRFRKKHLSALGNLFLAALSLCQAAGMVSLGVVALDGTKVRANASRRKAMSYARLTAKEKILAAEVSAMLADAGRIDDAEDAEYGKDRRGDELPEDLRRKESRLAAIRKAKEALEAEATARAEAAAEAKTRAAGADEGQVAERVAAAGAAAVPAPKAQRNFTDPESRIMKTADGSFHQCYNAQAVVDADHQVIVATDLTDVGNDVAALVPMVEQTIANTGTAPRQVLADAGYTSAANCDAAESGTESGTEFYLAPGRTKNDDPPPVAPRGRIPKSATPKQRMARKPKTKKGQQAYARRKAIVEPVFGQISTLQGKHVLLHGLEAARGEWLLIAACHNLRKLHQHLGTDGLTTLQTAR